MEVDKQRLIFQAKPLLDAGKLSDYRKFTPSLAALKILVNNLTTIFCALSTVNDDGLTIHLVAKPGGGAGAGA